MYEVLNQYLMQHKSISIPGLGSLVAETIPAVTDFANKQLLPVQLKFRYDKYFDAPDREFFSYLCRKKNMADYEAIKWYSEFAYELRHKIRSGEPAEWEGIGVFKKEVGGDIFFEPFVPQHELYAAVKAERVIHSNAKHSILVGDKEKTNYEMSEWLSDEVHVEKESWWIYALILAAIGLSLLFFNLYRSNKWGATGNKQNIEVVPK